MQVISLNIHDKIGRIKDAHHLISFSKASPLRYASTFKSKQQMLLSAQQLA